VVVSRKEIKLKAMRFIFISDVHANLPALEAVWQDIQQHQPDHIFCPGDLVNFAGWDNEVINFIREHRITSIQGNHDEGIGYENLHFKYSYKTQAQKEFGVNSIAYVNNTITPGNRRYLQLLPFSVKFEFRFPFHSICLYIVHGSRLSNTDYILPGTDEEQLLEMLDDVNADILIAGHTHKPFHKTIYTEIENHKLYRHFINAGFVGKPKHGDNRACYVLLNIDEILQLTNPSSVDVQFFYVPYDIEKVIEKIHSIGLGNAYDDFLLNGEV
jgi:predicted phosphodiesterase